MEWVHEEVWNHSWHRARQLVRPVAAALLFLQLPAGPSRADVVEIDAFESSTMAVELILPGGSVEVVELFGPSQMHVFFEGPVEGDAFDDDGNALEEVPAELTRLELSSNHPNLGPVTLELDPSLTSSGEMEELSNGTSDLLDVPPFAATGLLNSFFDVFFVVELAGLELHNAAPLRLRSQISHKPPAPSETYESLGGVPLFDADGSPTGIDLAAASYVPHPIVEVDHLETAATVELIAPDGSTEIIELLGPSEIRVFFEGPLEGDALDHNADGRDEVRAKLARLQLAGHSPNWGPVTLELDPALVSLGEMAELSNATPGLLEVPPFAATGLVDSFFDVFVVVELAGLELHNMAPMRLQSVISHKPPAASDTYQSSGSTPLFDANSDPTGFSLQNANLNFVPEPKGGLVISLATLWALARMERRRRGLR